MTQPFPPPLIQPFERLQVTDGLRVTAERWRLAHEYHRSRQNLHYQALNQPGIVCGLGVQPITPPENLDRRYRDGRWLRIQPGIAIDLLGNPIVVAKPIDFYVTTKPTGERVTVYLVLSYVDPDSLKGREQLELVQEFYRVDEKNKPPTGNEVEICRIELEPNLDGLKVPEDVFFPQANQLDLRYRLQVQARPQAVVRVGAVNHPEPETQPYFEQLAALVKAIAPLYPSLSATLHQATLPSDSQPDVHLDDYDLLYLTGRHPFFPLGVAAAALKTYLSQGGVLLVNVPADGVALAKSILDFARSIGTPLKYLEPPDALKPTEPSDRRHPLRMEPFLFAKLPQITEQSIQVMVGGGIVLLLGDLAIAWGQHESLLLPRETIRTAQEFGINILNFAYQRRNWMQLLQPNPAELSAIGQSADAYHSAPLGVTTPLPPNGTEKSRSEQMQRIVGRLQSE